MEILSLLVLEILFLSLVSPWVTDDPILRFFLLGLPILANCVLALKINGSGVTFGHGPRRPHPRVPEAPRRVHVVDERSRTLARRRMAPVRRGRTAIITGGATVVFQELLDEVVTAEFLGALYDAGFDIVYIQCGSAEEQIRRKLSSIQHKLAIVVTDFMDNMKETMKDCRGLRGGRPAGVVISHAGTGTIADCWEVKVANIIVANPNLMDNHQAVFAEDTARDHPTVILGRLGKLSNAIKNAMGVIHEQGLDNLPEYREPVFPLPDNLRWHMVDNLINGP